MNEESIIVLCYIFACSLAFLYQVIEVTINKNRTLKNRRKRIIEKIRKERNNHE